MDIKKFRASIGTLVNKYKYAVLIFLIGFVLMILPAGNKKDQTEPVLTEVSQDQPSVQEQLEEILSYIQGAGSVKVMLKEISGEETVYQTDIQTSTSETSSSQTIQSIIVEDSDNNESGLIRQINPPQYQGAVVLCQGADDPAVKLAIADAVSKITGLGLDKIAVLKMK